MKNFNQIARNWVYIEHAHVFYLQALLPALKGKLGAEYRLKAMSWQRSRHQILAVFKKNTPDLLLVFAINRPLYVPANIYDI